VPPSHDDQQPGILGETIEEVIRTPRPRLIAVKLGIGLRRTFDRIVDHTEIEPETVNGAVDCGVAKRSLVTNELNKVVVGRPARPANAQIRKDFAKGTIATNGAEQIAICGRAKFIRIGCKDRFELGIFPGILGDKIQNRC
jgi:hypothetical protein